MNHQTFASRQDRVHNSPYSCPVLQTAHCTVNLRTPVFLFALLLFLFVQPAFAAKQTAVIFPDVDAPYKEVFETIISGISAKPGRTVQRYPLSRDYRLEDLRNALKKNRPAGIITLGKRGYLAARKLQLNIPTVSGALSMVPNGISGVSLSADPAALFSRLKSLVPDSKRVFVVYSPKTLGWLIPLAKKAAKKQKLELFAYPAETLREAMLHYRSILQKIHGETDVIWLPLDKVTVNDDVVLPLLLQKAWDKDLVIMSNKPSHAKRGVLFALYPDNYGLGQELSELLDKQSVAPETSQVIPLKRLDLAVNLRTAAHLGLIFTPQQQEDFRLTFPSR